VISRDGATGLVGLAGSVALLLLTRGLPQSSLVPIGPAFYPRILLSISAALCALLVIDDLRAGRAHPARAAAVGYRLVILTFMIFAAYVGLMPWLGYRVSTFLFVLVLQITLEPRRGVRWWLPLTVAVLTTAATWLVFEHYLSVLLPRGRLTGF